MRNAIVPQLQALAMQIECLRSQVDAVLAIALGADSGEPQAPVDPAETCPACGASGETQADTSRVDGVQRRRCLSCGQERIL